MAATYIKVIFENGDHFATWINSTADEAERYYLNNYFNIGCGDCDNVQLCTGVEILIQKIDTLL